jgi:gas vesicle protein
MKGFLFGLGVGVGLGVLFSPMRGEDVRQLAAVRASEIADKAQQQYDRARDVADRAMNAIRGTSEEPKTGIEA